VSKAIDKAAGAEREVVGVHRRHGGGAAQSGSMSGPLGTAAELPLTVPSTDAARQWQGWGTALKPAHEPIVVARKPLIGTAAENVLQHGTGALNIDGCRVAGEPVPVFDTKGGRKFEQTHTQAERRAQQVGTSDAGRWPANVILDGSEELTALFPSAARFFYSTKASKADHGMHSSGSNKTSATPRSCAAGFELRPASSPSVTTPYAGAKLASQTKWRATLQA
jgi:hypothetical protein